jgi:hypothetical protein
MRGFNGSRMLNSDEKIAVRIQRVSHLKRGAENSIFAPEMQCKDACLCTICVRASFFSFDRAV